MTKLKDLSLFKDNNYGLYVDGEWINSKDNSIFTVTNPSTEEVIAEIPKLGGKETKAAIAAADKAFKSWSQLTAKERGDYLTKLHDIMIENSDELAKIMSMEMGKALTEAKGEVVYAASFLTWFAEEGRRIYGETIPADR